MAARGWMQPVGDETPASRLTFLFNPNQVSRRRTPVYAHSNVALVDHFQSGAGSVPVQWVRNPPETISFELMLDISKKPGYGTNDPYQKAKDLDIEDELRLLDSFSQKTRFGEPPELKFTLGGKKVERIRLTNVGRVEKLFSPDGLNVTQATVSIEAIVTFSVGQ